MSYDEKKSKSVFIASLKSSTSCILSGTNVGIPQPVAQLHSNRIYTRISRFFYQKFVLINNSGLLDYIDT